MHICVNVEVCIYLHCPKKLKVIRIFGVYINSKLEDYWIFLGHLHLIAYKTQGIKKQAFDVKYDEILAYFIKSWIKKDEIWAV